MQKKTKLAFVVAGGVIGVGAQVASTLLGPWGISIDLAAGVLVGAVALVAARQARLTRKTGRFRTREAKQLAAVFAASRRRPMVARSMSLACDASRPSAWRAFGEELAKTAARKTLAEVAGITLLAVVPPVAMWSKAVGALRAGWDSGAFVHEVATLAVA